MAFEAPTWLYLLPVALAGLLLLFLHNTRARKTLIRRFASDRLVAQLLTSYSPARRKFKAALILLATTALFAALARPIIGFEWRETKSKGIDILFALDTSRSMLAQDIRPDRLSRTKLAILDFVDKLETDRVGLIAFAGEAFLQCPLTLDYGAFRQTLEAIDTNTIPVQGTDIARAISEAEAAFGDDNNFKILVLISDGEDLEEDGVTRAREAAGNGVTIYTVGVGTPDGSTIPIRNHWGQLEHLRDHEGNVVITRLDEHTLNSIAEVTGGFYVPLGTTGYGLEQVYQAGLEGIPREELASRMERTGLQRFQWPLALAIILLAWEPLIGSRRRIYRPKANPSTLATTLMLALTALACLSTETRAQGNATPSPNSHLQSPETDPRRLYNRGNTLYTQGDYAAAAQAWADTIATAPHNLPLQADAFYNLGNARYRQGTAAMPEASFDTLTQTATQAHELLEHTYLTLEQGQRSIQAPPQERHTLWTQAEALLEQLETFHQTIDLQPWQSTRQHWEEAERHYLSARDLIPRTDAEHNLTFVRQRLHTLTIALTQTTDFQKEYPELKTRLEQLITELKKPTSYVLDIQQQADALIAQGDFPGAYQIMHQAVEQDPTSWIFEDKYQRLQQLLQKLTEDQQ